MPGQHRWAIGLATGTGLLGLTMTGGLTFLAHCFVEEFSRPHQILPHSEFTWKEPRPLAEPPLSLQRALLFAATDGTLLHGEFWAQPRVAPTIVLCHGYRTSSDNFRSVATLQYACGYNVLLFDFRGHGHSDSVATSGGSAEVLDLEAALLVASQQPETLPDCLIIHGFSMGAAVALLATPRPEVAAIIADSPFARLDDILRRLVHWRLAHIRHLRHPALQGLQGVLPVAAWSTIAACTIVFRVRFGHGLSARPVASIKRWYKRKMSEMEALKQHRVPILLIHATRDPLIPFAHAQEIVSIAHTYEVPLETHFVECEGHCSAYGSDPRAYNLAIRDFLAHHLVEKFPEQHRTIDIEEISVCLSPEDLTNL